MNNRIKDVYLGLGHVLNNPKVFGLGERAPKILEEALSRMQQELFEELKEQLHEDDSLSLELSQDADCSRAPFVTSTSFTLKREGN
ncbi:MAG TPA: hypothetical protein VFB79_00990 [Candidatus Angelobacter sp.]|nr:hypothetical protein [Candidatus Angelobacter sp.]